VAATAIVLSSCGGGDGDDATTTSTTLQTIVTNPATTLPLVTTPLVTEPLPPTSVVYVTEGASVLVTNASRINGAAGRLTDRLAAVGFETVTPGNYTLGTLDLTKIYYDPANAAALAVADSLKAAFGGGSIEIVELGTAPPVDTGSMGGASILIAMGNDIADKTLNELQGIETPEDTGSDTSSTATDAGTSATSG
jgi:hypothetical protein